jgi:hypothetical protein
MGEKPHVKPDCAPPSTVTSGLQILSGPDQAGQDMSSCDGCTVPGTATGFEWALMVILI